MKILKEFPPNIAEIRNTFDLSENVVFTYGDTLYNPGNGFIDPSLMAHEETHMRQQQKIGIVKWWQLYLKFEDFRAAQEIEAYQNQYKVLKKIFKDRNRLNFHLVRIAKDLSGPMYGNIMSFGEASKVIKSDKKHEFNFNKLR